jgi:hypothetical protein
MRIVRIKDIIFDKTLFYDLAKLDSKHLLITNVENTLKILEVSNNIFFEVIIEKDDEADQMIDHLKDESIELRFVKSIYQVEKTFFLHIDMKNIYLLTFEMISNRNQKFNTNIIDTMSLLQIDLKIDEILNSVQNQSILNSRIENESQSQSSIISKKSKQSMIMLADAMIMNIRFRKQTYSTALITIEMLESFHAAFSIDLKRSNQKKSQISKLHRNDLFVESRYWRQMLRYRFSQKFQMIAQKELFELKKRSTFSMNWKSESINNSFDLSVQIQIWHRQLSEKIQDTIMCQRWSSIDWSEHIRNHADCKDVSCSDDNFDRIQSENLTVRCD